MHDRRTTVLGDFRAAKATREQGGECTRRIVAPPHGCVRELLISCDSHEARPDGLEDGRGRITARMVRASPTPALKYTTSCATNDEARRERRETSARSRSPAEAMSRTGSRCLCIGLGARRRDRWQCAGALRVRAARGNRRCCRDVGVSIQRGPSRTKDRPGTGRARQRSARRSPRTPVRAPRHRLRRVV